MCIIIIYFFHFNHNMKFRRTALFSLKLGTAYKSFGLQPSSVGFYRHFSSRPMDISFSAFEPNKTSNSVPIIILHGFLGSKQNWRGLAKAIANKTHRQVYALDARNHGDSLHSDDFSYSVMCEDVKQFMTKQSIGKAVLIGHSMGGRTVMKLALTEKQLVDKLVIVDVSPLKMPESSTVLIPGYLSAMKSTLSSIHNLGIVKARKVADELLAQSVSEAPIRQFLLTNLIEKGGKIIWKPNIDVLEKTFLPEICYFSEFSGCFMEDTLFICGGESPYVKETDYSSIRKLFPRAEFIVIHGAGHWVHSEKPTEFLEALYKFI